MAANEQASERASVGADALMENAGLSVAQAARGELGGVAGVRIVALVGPGNSGADELVAARQYGVEILPFPDTDVLERLRQQGICLRLRLRLRSDAPQRHNVRRRAGNMTATGKSVKAVFGDGKSTA